MLARLRWGVPLFLSLGVSWAGCSSRHDAAGGAAGEAGSASGNAGTPVSAAGGNAQAGAGPGGAAGGLDNGSSGDAGAHDSAASGGVSSGGSAGTAGSAASGPGGEAGTAGESGGCQEVEVSFSSNVPTVFVLVDRSSSMFRCLTGTNGAAGVECPNANDSAWSALKQSVLDVVQQLQGSVRFAFGSFTGQLGTSCPSFSSVVPALNNYEAIHDAYDALAAPTFKAETPTVQALGLVQTLLAADPSPGPKSVLLVTDGEPDFCDDGDTVCPVDATVGKLQAMYAAGFGALVLGLDSPLTSISSDSLQAFANAGAGRPVVDPSSLGSNLYYRCGGIPAWSTLFAATGKASPAPIATYGSAGSDATLYRPSPSNAAALEQALGVAVASVKSCSFDLTGGIAVDLAALSGASLTIQGQLVAQSATNGWNMANEKRLQLNGSACSAWRSPGSQNISFHVPCGSVKPE